MDTIYIFCVWGSSRAFLKTMQEIEKKERKKYNVNLVLDYNTIHSAIGEKEKKEKKNQKQIGKFLVWSRPLLNNGLVCPVA